MQLGILAHKCLIVFAACYMKDASGILFNLQMLLPKREIYFVFFGGNARRIPLM